MKSRKISVDKAYFTRLKRNSESLRWWNKELRERGLGLSEWELKRLRELIESGEILKMSYLDCALAFTAGTARQCCRLIVDALRKAKGR